MRRGAVMRWGTMLAMLASICMAAPPVEELPVRPIQIKARPPEIQKRQTLNAQQFAGLADAILQQYDAHRHKYLRFIAIQEGEKSPHEQVNYIANAVYSRTGNRIKPEVLNDNIAVIEGDRLCPNAKDLENFLVNWESLAKADSFFQPTFTLPAVEKLQAGAKVTVLMKDKSIVDATFVSIDAQGLTQVKIVSSGKIIPAHKSVVTPVQGAIIAAAHLGDAGVRLVAATGSAVPIMEFKEWSFTSFSAIKKNGGQYYQQAGIRKSQAEGRTDFEQWLLDRGASLEIVERLGSKAKTLTLRSDVTEKTRLGVYFYSLATSPDIGPSLVLLTFDPSEDLFDNKSNPLENISVYDKQGRAKFSGIEAIVFLPNGMLQYVAFNEKFEIADFVPDDIARDKLAPDHAGTARITGAYTCMRCHDKYDNSNGFRSVTNDALRLGRGDLTQGIIADLSSGNRGTEDIDRLLKEFMADPDSFLVPARLMFAKAVYGLTGKSSHEMSKLIGDTITEYAHGSVTPEAAAKDLGWIVKEGEGMYFLDEILPLVVQEDGIVIAGQTLRGFRENSAVQWLKKGASQQGQQWRLYRRQAMLRALFQEQEWKKEKEKINTPQGDKSSGYLFPVETFPVLGGPKNAWLFGNGGLSGRNAHL